MCADLPLVSVVVPCLNRAHFLVPTIESILNQEYSNIECIVVDGGSTDGTLEILNHYGDRIKWISEPDNGHADAINKGWQMSSGEILAWLNADDMWVMPNAVSQAIAYLQLHPEIDVIQGYCRDVDIEGNVSGITLFREWNLDYAVEYCSHCITQPATFIRRSILEKVGWLDVAFYQKKDHELWLRIGLEGRIEYVPFLLAYERKIKGLSYDAQTAAPACLQVTEKFYSLPNVPLNLKHKKRRAFSNSYLRGMEYAFVGGPIWSIIFSYGVRAILVDATNVLNVFRHLEWYIAASTSDSSQPIGRSFGLKLLSLPGHLFRKFKRLRSRYT